MLTKISFRWNNNVLISESFHFNKQKGRLVLSADLIMQSVKVQNAKEAPFTEPLCILYK